MMPRLSARSKPARKTRAPALPVRLLGSTALCAAALLATLGMPPARAADWEINSTETLTTSATFDTVYIGVSQSGDLTISGGGALSSRMGSIGAIPNATGAVTVTGDGSTWTNTQYLRVGHVGTGTLTIADGGTVAVGTLNSSTNTYDGTLSIASTSGSTGRLIIGGALSGSPAAAGTLHATAVEFGDGDGTIVFNHTDTNYTFAATISGEGDIEVYSGTTTLSGDSSGFTGNTTVNGGTLTVTGTLGSTSSAVNSTVEGGSLTIEDGGTVSGNSGYIGITANSSGSVTVTGANSTWANYGSLMAGYFGTGTLTIADGGTVSVGALNISTQSYNGTVNIATMSGSTGTLNIGAAAGDTAVAAGTLQAETVAFGAGLGSIVFNHTETDYTFAANIQGNGVIDLQSGTTTLSGNSVGFTGTTTVHNATLNVTGTLGGENSYIGYFPDSTSTVTVAGGGAYWVINERLYTGYAGTGSLTIADGGIVINRVGHIGSDSGAQGTVTVTGDNSTWTNSNAVFVGEAGTGTLTIADGGTVQVGVLNTNTQTLDGTVTIASFSGSTGTLNIGAAAGDTAVAAGTLQAAWVAFGSGTGTIVFNHTDTDYIFATAISGAGTLDFDSGTTTLSGDSSSFTGTTTVDDATLIINSVLGGTLQINGGGTLGGTGTVGTTTLASGATISPGLAGAIGTLTVDGDLTFESGSTYAVDVSSSASDQILVSGTADISGGTVSVTALDDETSYQTGQTYTILSATTVTGSFAQTLSNSAFLDVSTATVDNTAVLTIAVRTNGGVFTPLARTTTQSAVARSLDTLEQSGTSLALYNELLLMSDEEAVETFQQMSGDVYASERSALASNTLAVNTTVNNRIRSVFDGVAAPSVPVLGYAEDTGSSTDDEPFVALGAHNGPAQAVEAERFAIWGSAFGSWGSMDGTDGASDTDTASGGVLAGIDKLFLDTVRLGAFAGYSHSAFDTSSSRGNSGNYHAGLYGGAELGHLAVRSGLSYTWYDVSSSRKVSYLGQTLKGTYDANSFNVFGELGYRIDLGRNAFEPFAGLAHTRLETDGFSETGGSAALTVGSSTMDTTYTTLGLRASREFFLRGVSLTARGSAAWQHAFGDLDPRTSARFISGDSFSVSSTPIDENVAVLEAGFDIKPTANAILGFSYTGQIGQNAVENGVNAKLRMKF